MNDETPPPFDTVGDAPVEARIVAWVLGEASAFEVAELERLCEERPELLVFRRRMRALHGLLTEAEAAESDHSWKLPPEKRKAIEEILGEEKIVLPDTVKEKRISHSGRRAFLAIAACVLLTIIVVKLIGPIRRMGPMGMETDPVAAESAANISAINHETKPASLKANGSYRVESRFAESSREPAGKKSKEQALLAKRNAAPASEAIAPQDAAPRPMSAPAQPSELDRLPPIVASGLSGSAEDPFSDGSDAYAGRVLDESMKSSIAPATAPSGQAIGQSMSRTRSLGVEAPDRGIEADVSAWASKQKTGSRNAGLDAISAGNKTDSPADRPPVLAAKKSPASVADKSEERMRSSSASLPGKSQVEAPVRRQLYLAEGNLQLGQNEEAKAAYQEALDLDPANKDARYGLTRADEAMKDQLRVENNNTRAELLSQADTAWELTIPATDAAVAADAKNTELLRESAFPMEYEPPAEEAQALVDALTEIPASENPYSTFSLNISDASFQLAKAALARGERPDPTSIKPEQFYNAVDYGDPAPASNQPVAATIEQSAHPVIPGRNFVRIAIRTGSVGRSAVQPLHLTLLVDQSGSMVREDRRAAMEHALQQLGVLLTKNDLVTVIGFSRTPHLLADAMTGDQATKLSDLVNQTASEGGTNLEEALKLGGQLATRHQLAGAQNRIVLFTDGAANLGDAKPARLAEQVKSFRQQGLAFDIAGIGADGLNDRLLSELARNGNGRYYVVRDEKNDSFARQLAGAFRPAAENVKVQVNFNPQRVGKYKLIGFEKDRLKTEDFRNDAVDAAELAAEEAGVAIYQVEPLADGTGEIGDVSVRFRDVASNEMVERTWTIPYESQATAFDRATPSMQLAGLSLLAAEKLRGGPMADAIDFKQLTEPTSSVKQFYGHSPRVADMLQVIDALK